MADESAKQARLAAWCGIRPGEDLSPPVIDLDDTSTGNWPLALVRRTGHIQVVEDLASKFAGVPQGPWSDPPCNAVVVPIRSRLRHLFAGYLVAGLSPRLAFDDEYGNFLELATAQIATAIANAKAYEEERKRAQALAEIDQAKTLFFSNVSHEFRTPITLLLGPLEDALRGNNLPPGLRDQIEVAHRNSLRLLRLVNSLLDFSRIEAGRVKAVYEPTDLCRVTTELASNFRSATERAGLALTVDCPPLSEPVYVDREMWEKIVLNLLSNAFKFTFQGGIEVRLRPQGDHVELAVRDTGTGIPADELPHLFERFHRVKGARSRTHEGTGIGLALVQQLVQLHGGSIHVESAVDQGTTFTVSVPFGKAHLPPEQVGGIRETGSTAIRADAFVEEALRWLPEPQPLENEKPVATELGTTDRSEWWDKKPGEPLEKVLVVDDNADMRDYLRRLLTPRYEVITATRGDEALDIALSEGPDLVLADIMMPGMDGFEFLRAIRSDPTAHTMLVILLSARAGEEARTEGMKAGADDYLIKPFGAREVLARVGAHLDLTRVRRQAEQILKESRDRLALAQGIARAGSFDVDLKTNDVVWSEELQALYGAGPDRPNVNLDEWTQWVLPDDRERVLADFAAGLEKGEVTTQFRIRRRDTGEIRWIEGRGRTLRDADGTPTRMMGFNIDISEQKRAEEALRASEARERARAAELEGILDSAPVAMFIARDSEARDITGSRMTYEMLRLPPGSNISFAQSNGRRPACRIERDGRELSPAELPVPKAAATGQTIRDYECDLVYDDGTRRNLLGLAVPLFDTQHRPRGSVGAFLDITERKHHEEQIRQTQKLESVGLLAAGIAHDFNNLLTGILGNASMVLNDLPPGPAERIREVVTAAERAAHLTRQLLAYSGKGQFIVRDLDVSQAVQEIVDLVEFSIPKSVQLAVTVEKRLPLVRMDPSQLQQILMNLVINAGEAIGESQPGRITVATSVKDVGEAFVDAIGEQVQAGRYVCAEITDTGGGISEEAKSKIFDPFFTTKFTGRGLGLAAVAGILRAQKGGITVANAPGGGAIFRAFLPAAEARVRELQAPPDRTARATVLVADDERTVREIISAILRQSGYRVLTASDSQEALALCRRSGEKIDAAVLDIVMPLIRLDELLPVIKALQPDIRILLTSGYSESEARRLCTDYPGAGFIQKPYTAQQLAKAVEKILDQGGHELGLAGP